MSSDVVLKVDNVGKRYEIYSAPHHRLLQTIFRGRKQFYKEFWALKNISFEVARGETLGIIGLNGSGKSTLLQVIAGTLAPTTGNVSADGRLAALLELGSGFNPEFTGRENVFMNGTIMGLSRKEMEERIEEIIAFADIGEFIDQPVKFYSSGMMVRLAFAVQAQIDAAIVIIDEALAVGDVFFRQKCYARLDQLRNSGTAILLVSHSMPEIEQYCKRAILLDCGSAKFIGSATEATKHYYLLHQASYNETPDSACVSVHSLQEVQESSVIMRPLAEAFLDISKKVQVGNGKAHCTGLALSDSSGRLCNSFRQGELGVFYYEFEIIEDIGVPICGIIISNDRGVIVHGKNSWQYPDLEWEPGVGKKVVCRQEFVLQLAPGEYVFEVGLAAVKEEVWQRRKFLSHEYLSANHIRICHIANAGMFSVYLAQQNGVFVLTHHGVADLPGKIEVALEPALKSKECLS
ncbi:MAG: ABC transporter ATP-binding protein [Candidatus Omnitrophota bacterium]|jgi:lipopolysaccharide transport system ATP-binding protein